MRNDPVRTAVCVLGYTFLLPFGYLFAGILHVAKVFRPFFAFTVCVAIVVLVNWLIPIFWRWLKSSIDVRFFFLHYAADRKVGVSHVEAMISAGSYQAAADEVDALLAKHGVEASVCSVGLDLHLGKFGSRERGEALLRRMRAENPAQYEKMATQRLIDIYMERSETHGKALTELRRVISRFPDTPEAAGALHAVARLKQQQISEAQAV